jgi:hypothetical protein
MKLLKYSDLREDGGWIQGALVEIRPGVEVLITDDTHLVTAVTKKGSGKVTIKEVQEAWQRYHLGGSDFPGDIGRKEGEALGKRYGYNPKIFGWENGYGDIEDRVADEMEIDLSKEA